MARKGLNIYKRKDGRWEARYIKSRNTQGKPRYGYLYATSYHEVRNNLQRVIQAMNTYDAEKVPATNCKFMGFSAIDQFEGINVYSLPHFTKLLSYAIIPAIRDIRDYK